LASCEALSLANSSESQRKISPAAGVSFSRREFRNREAVHRFVKLKLKLPASVGANSGIVRRMETLEKRSARFCGFSRREFRNREAAPSEAWIYQKQKASVGANSGIVRRK